ncbi:MAG: WYL domain-containing protein, partial [Acidimicrobiales bacterium]
ERLASLPGGDAAAVAFAAIGERRRLRFSYKGSERLVDPWKLSFRRGQWYLAGLDHSRGEERLFRLDRVGGEVSPEGPPAAFERPAGLAAAPILPWRLGDEDEVTAELLVDADQAGWAAEALGPGTDSLPAGDGAVVFRFLVTNRAAFRSFVLGFLDHAEVLGPPALRDDMAAWLAGIAGAGSLGRGRG